MAMIEVEQGVVAMKPADELPDPLLRLFDRA
jgi:hypothetical protein